MQLFQELQRRNVFRVAIGYIVSSWLLIQVADLVLENIGSPDWVLQTIMLVLALGFPVVVFFSWAYEVTPEGVKRESEIDRTQSITHVTGRKLDRAIVAVLVIALAYFAYDKFVLGPRRDAELVEGMKQAVTEQVMVETNVTTEPDKSIAVLPFTTRSNVEDDRFFSDGMHDDLLTQLAKISDLSVISRTSVMEYRDTTKNLRQIGTELGVSAILEGAVQRSGRQVRINVQLIDAQTDKHLWAEVFDRELTTENLFAIQTEIARAIAAALQATLSPEEDQSIEHRSLTNNLEALKAYQRSKLLERHVDRANLMRAEQEARNAVELDPGFAAGWAQLARVQLALFWHVETKPEYLEAARKSIETGRAIDPALPELDIAEGYYFYWGFRDYENALRVLTPVLKTYPNDADLHSLLGYINRRYGRIEQALEHLHKAQTLEPRSISAAQNLSETYVLLRDVERAKEYLRWAEDIDPSDQRVSVLAGNISYSMDGDPAAAARYFQTLQHDTPYEYWLALIAMDQQTSFTGFDDFNTTQMLGEMLYTPSLMRGLTLRLSDKPDDAQPLLDEARAYYAALLAEGPDDFRLLKPLCLVDGARGDAAAAAASCLQALEHLPKDTFDTPFHREDIAGALALAGLNEQSLDLVENLLSGKVGPTLTELQLNPLLRGLHDEPRWLELMNTPGD